MNCASQQVRGYGVGIIYEADFDLIDLGAAEYVLLVRHDEHVAAANPILEPIWASADEVGRPIAELAECFLTLLQRLLEEVAGDKLAEAFGVPVEEPVGADERSLPDRGKRG